MATMKTATPKKKVNKAKLKRDQKAAIIQNFTAPTIEQQTTSLVETPKLGRPSDYTPEIATEFCQRIAEGNSLRSVCRADDMPHAKTIFRWLPLYEDFRQQYTRATEERAEAMAEDILDIADDGTNDYMEIKDADGEYTGGWRTNGEAIKRSKLRVDSRQWLMGKMKPKRYGPKLDVTSDGSALPAPLIYIPRELPYNAINQVRESIDVEVETEPPRAGQNQTNGSARLPHASGQDVVPGTTHQDQPNRQDQGATQIPSHISG